MMNRLLLLFILTTYCTSGIAQKECADPVSSDPHLMMDTRTYPNIVVYTCDSGYRLSSTYYFANCRNGVWDQVTPTCQAAECPVNSELLLYPPDMTFYYGDTASFSCPMGYDIKGPSILQCGADSLWDKELPECIAKECKLKPNGRTYRGRVNVTVSGRVCQDWASHLPHMHAYYELRDHENYCRNPNYNSGGPWCYTIDPSVQWEYCDVMRCMCDLPPRYDSHLNVVNKDHYYDEYTFFSCDVGYELQGTPSLRCLADGSWSGVFPSCQAVECPIQSNIDKNLRYQFRTYYFNDTLVLSCANGFKLTGSSSLTCGSNKGWSNVFPMCTAVQCGISGDLPQLRYEKRTYLYQDEIHFSCPRGYDMVGQGILLCTADGSWSMPFPSCNLITCSCPGTSSHLLYTDQLYRPGDEISLTCLHGYTLDGASILECGEDGLWNTDLPTCQAVPCPAPDTEEEHLLMEDRQYRYTDKLVLSCDVGFQVDGPSSLVCEANGTWSGQLPVCRQLQRADMISMQSPQMAGLVTGLVVVFFGICVVLLIAIKRRKKKKNEDRSGNQEGIGTSVRGNNYDTHSDISDDYDTFSDTFDEDIEMGVPAKVRANTYYEFCPLAVAPNGTIPVDALGEFVNKDLRVEGYISSTFANFKEGLQEPATVANLPENKSKNKFNLEERFSNKLLVFKWEQTVPLSAEIVEGLIRTDDKTRVCLQKEAGNTSDYINASYINGYEKVKQYVAAQGPIRTTINDFWQMIWQLGSTKIVMLTKLTEGAKVKCQQYWPNTGSEQFGSLTVTVEREEDISTYIIRQLKVQNGSETRSVTQFHYMDWPDQKVPSSPSSLVQFFRKVEPLGQVLDVPIVVHCSAGIGRTGTYIALACLVQEAAATGYVSVTRCVETLRRQRLNMVQTAKQFVFIHEALLEHLHGSTAIPVSVFRETFRQVHVEFDNLQKLSPKLPENAFVAGKKEENKNKNRYSNLLPVDKYRPLLSTPIDGHNDYINAVFLSDGSKRVEYLTTQMPLPHTVVDLWRLVYEQHVTSIVMLNTECDQQDDRIGVYWPTREEQLRIGPFVVSEISRASHHLTDIFTLSLQYKQETHTNVRQFRSRVWPDSEVCPTSTLEFLRLLGLVREWQSSQHGAVLVHCMNGLDKSGLFCVLDATLQAADVSQFVDIQTTIKQMRRAQPKIIPNEKQYLFCYEAISMYLEQSRTYMNV